MWEAITGAVATVLAAVVAVYAKHRLKAAPALLEVRPFAHLYGVSFTMDHTQNERKGMLIKVDLALGNLEGVDCGVYVYFSFSNGQPLPDSNGQYRTYENQVSVGEGLLPLRREQIFRDVEMFLPYDELHLQPGTHSLSLFLRVCREATNETLLTTGNYTWTFTQVESLTPQPA